MYNASHKYDCRKPSSRKISLICKINKTRTYPKLYMYKCLCITGNGMHGGSSGSFCLLFVYNRTTVSILQSPWYPGSTGFPALLLVHVWCSADSRYSATKNYEQK